MLYASVTASFIYSAYCVRDAAIASAQPCLGFICTDRAQQHDYRGLAFVAACFKRGDGSLFIRAGRFAHDGDAAVHKLLVRGLYIDHEGCRTPCRA